MRPRRLEERRAGAQLRPAHVGHRESGHRAAEDTAVHGTYCKYGAPYRKQSRLWTNMCWRLSRGLCRSGCRCEAWEDGRRLRGAQGPAREQSRELLYSIPTALCEEIASASPRLCGSAEAFLQNCPQGRVLQRLRVGVLAGLHKVVQVEVTRDERGGLAVRLVQGQGLSPLNVAHNLLEARALVEAVGPKIAGMTRRTTKKERHAQLIGLLGELLARKPEAPFTRLFLFYDRAAENSALPCVAEHCSEPVRAVSRCA